MNNLQIQKIKKLLRLWKLYIARIFVSNESITDAFRSFTAMQAEISNLKQELNKIKQNTIIHVKQPTPTSCVAACIAMLTGLDINKILEEFPEPVGTEGLHKMLNHYGLKWNPVKNNVLFPGKCYLAIVPSLNMVGHNHQIIIDLRYEGNIYDPNKYREEKYFYTLYESPSKYAFTMVTWTELIEIELSNLNILSNDKQNK